MLIVEDTETSYLKGEDFLMQEETYRIIGLAMETHKFFGKGYLEIVYKDALEIEFKDHDIFFEREKPYTIEYKGRVLKRRYTADFVVYGNLILEVKAQSGILRR